MIDPRVKALCDEFGITIVDRHVYPDIGQTRAVETLARILRRFGEGHLRMVLTTLAGPFKVRSRAEAQQAFDTRKRLEKARERERNGRNHSHLCIECKEREFAWMSQEPKRRNRYPKLAAAGGRYA